MDGLALDTVWSPAWHDDEPTVRSPEMLRRAVKKLRESKKRGLYSVYLEGGKRVLLERYMLGYVCEQQLAADALGGVEESVVWGAFSIVLRALEYRDVYRQITGRMCPIPYGGVDWVDSTKVLQEGIGGQLAADALAGVETKVWDTLNDALSDEQVCEVVGRVLG